MSSLSHEESINDRQDRLLTTLERLLELPASAAPFMFDQAVQQIQEVLSADLVNLLFHDASSDTLVALHISDTPMGRQQRAIGLNRLPLANRGIAVDVFLSGVAFRTGHADRHPHEPLGMVASLGVKSRVAAVFKVQTVHRGVVLAASATPDFFSVNDLNFLEAIARWVGLVVGRNELIEHMEQPLVEQDQKRVAQEVLPILAHELRNYLQPLRGRLDLIMERAQREEREKDVRDAESGIHTLQLLARGISDVVDIANLSQGMFALTPVSMSLKEVLQDVVTAFSARTIPISIRSPQEVIVTADPQRMRQAFETMLLYVLNLPSRPSEITVELSTERRTDGPWVSLSVKSTGSSANTESHMHTNVVSSHSNQPGVQLYITNQIALAHHGTLTIASASQQENSLTLAFPVEEEELIVRGDVDIQIML